MKSALLIAILSSMMFVNAVAQVITAPAYGLKSHETMEVVSVEMKKDQTIVHLTVENRTVSGYFCVDRNTFIVLPDGSRIKMLKADGIPNCPQSYNFKRVGEIIKFSLQFSALPPGSDWFDLVEECSENCFSVYGVTLNASLNDEIEKAYALSESGKPAEAAAS